MPGTVILVETLDYPDSDGLPMAENDSQRKTMTYAIEALDAHFQNRPDVYVSGNLLLHYEEGNKQACVAPDVFVARGVPKRERRAYLLWEESKGPDFVLEVTSRSTRGVDQGKKREAYAQLGVSEYWLYDRTGDYLVPALQGSRLVEGQDEPIPHAEQSDGAQRGARPGVAPEAGSAGARGPAFP